MAASFSSSAARWASGERCGGTAFRSVRSRRVDARVVELLIDRDPIGSEDPLERGEVYSVGIDERAVEVEQQRGAASPSHRRSDLPGHELGVAVAERLRLRTLARRDGQHLSKISRPFTAIDTPSRISPQLKSMSSAMRRYMAGWWPA